jgi:hypothetical protein
MICDTQLQFKQFFISAEYPVVVRTVKKRKLKLGHMEEEPAGTAINTPGSHFRIGMH